MDLCILMYERERQKNTQSILEARTKLQDLEFSNICKKHLLTCCLQIKS